MQPTCKGVQPLGLVSLTEAEPLAINSCTAERLPLLQKLNIRESSGTARMGLKLNCHPTGVLQRVASIPHLTPSQVSHHEGKNVKDEIMSTVPPGLGSTRTDIVRKHMVPNRVSVADVRRHTR